MQARKAVIYHNPKCSKSNAALNLLLEKGVEVDIVDYLETPLSNAAIGKLLEMLGIEAKKLIRFGEPAAKASRLAVDDIRDEQEWIAFMVQNPVLIERPIIVIDNKAVIGRPAEAILEIIPAD